MQGRSYSTVLKGPVANAQRLLELRLWWLLSGDPRFSSRMGGNLLNKWDACQFDLQVAGLSTAYAHRHSTTHMAVRKRDSCSQAKRTFASSYVREFIR